MYGAFLLCSDISCSKIKYLIVENQKKMEKKEKIKNDEAS